MARLLLHHGYDGFMNMAIDLYLLNSPEVLSDEPVLRIYDWAVPTVTLGWFQKINEQVDISFCRSAGIPVIRRISGGGTVLHHREITYSISLSQNKYGLPSGIEESIKYLLTPVSKSLTKIGIEDINQTANDIFAGNSKISGNAQYRTKNRILQHGTILTGIDYKLMKQCLKPSKDHESKTMYYKPLASFADYFNDDDIRQSESLYKKILIELFSDILGISFINNDLTDTELDKAAKISGCLFNNPAWNSDSLAINARKRMMHATMEEINNLRTTAYMNK